jgi:hypothetical protein
MMLRSINPGEVVARGVRARGGRPRCAARTRVTRGSVARGGGQAALVDAASGMHVRFRLGGTTFPPAVYYKVRRWWWWWWWCVCVYVCVVCHDGCMCV